MHESPEQIAQFIKQFAITAFNEQFDDDRDWRDFKVLTIAANRTSQFGYEICDFHPTNPLKIHLYVSLISENRLSKYQLCDVVNQSGGYLEKVFVANAEFNEDFLYIDNNYVRRSQPKVYSLVDLEHGILDEETGEYILAENDEVLLAETAP
jgi:hypothetical protein